MLVIFIQIFCLTILHFSAFVVIHNGIVTNYMDIKKFLMSKGYSDFESETDTEASKVSKNPVKFMKLMLVHSRIPGYFLIG